MNLDSENPVRVRAHEDPAQSFAIGLVFFQRQPDGRSAYGEVVMRPKPEGGLGSFPHLYLERAQAQELMDSLWSCGLRPREAAGSAGQLQAVEKHLEDMKRIAFELLQEKLGKGAGQP